MKGDSTMKIKMVKMIALMAAVTLSGCSAGTLENTGNSASDSAANMVSSNKKASSSTKGSNNVSSTGTVSNTISGAAGNTANSTAGNTTGGAAGNTTAATAGNTSAGAAGNTTASTVGNTTASTTSNTTTATTDDASDILSTTTITLYDSDGNTVSVERTIYKNYDCEYVDADGMEYSTDDDVYFTDENGKTYQSLNDSTHYFGAELEQHVLQDANGNSVTVTETTNGDYYYMDDNGIGYIDNGDGSWSDENGNNYTEE